MAKLLPTHLAAAISSRLLVLPRSNWSFYGEPFGTSNVTGEIWGAWYFDVLDAVALDDRAVTVRTVRGDALTVWEPADWEVTDEGFVIRSAARLRWRYKAQPPSSSTITTTYVRRGDTIHVETDEVGGRVFHLDPDKPALITFGASGPRTRHAHVYWSESAVVLASVGWTNSGSIENGWFKAVPRGAPAEEIGKLGRLAIDHSGPLFDPDSSVHRSAWTAIGSALEVPGRPDLQRMPESVAVARRGDAWTVRAQFPVGRRKPRSLPLVSLPPGEPTDELLGGTILSELTRAQEHRVGSADSVRRRTWSEGPMPSPRGSAAP